MTLTIANDDGNFNKGVTRAFGLQEAVGGVSRKNKRLVAFDWHVHYVMVKRPAGRLGLAIVHSRERTDLASVFRSRLCRFSFFPQGPLRISADNDRRFLTILNDCIF